MCRTMKMKIFIIAIVFLSVNCEQEIPTACDRTGKVKDVNNTIVMDMKETCKSKPCVFKCCDIDHYLYFNATSNLRVCLHKDKFQQYMNVSQIKFDTFKYPIYKSVEKNNKTKSEKDFFKDYTVLIKENFKLGCRQIVKNSTRMLEDGRIYKLINTKFELENSLEYCVDKFVYVKKKNNHTKYKYKVYLLMESQNEHKNKAVFTGAAMLISSFFMGLVLLVYSIIKPLRNIQGMIFMGYMATFLIGYVLKATSYLGLTYGIFDDKECKYLTPFCYGFILSIFFWMNVMSFDIWWTFRATRKIRSIHRQGELMKFMWYGLYAWGTPAAIVIAAYCIDNADNNNIIKPRFDLCLKTGKGAYVYLFGPILILIVINTLFFMMTIYNLWLIKRAMSNYDPPSQGSIKMNRNRFWVYVKLFLLMGVGWILELIQLLFDSTSDWVYMLLSSPNVFVGVAIFFMFVFKKAVYTKLAKKCKKINTKSSRRTTEYSGSGKSKSNYNVSNEFTMKSLETTDTKV